jgi:non-ribosomal peptide synthetase component E (peptide arylation enzyme)
MLADDLLSQLRKLPNMGSLDAEQVELYNELEFSISSVRLVKIGISVVLNHLQYEIDSFARCFAPSDDRQENLEDMIDLITEFMESPRYHL